jgi:hypothetical protein
MASLEPFDLDGSGYPRLLQKGGTRRLASRGVRYALYLQLRAQASEMHH